MPKYQLTQDPRTLPTLANNNNRELEQILADIIPTKVSSDETGSIVAAKKLIKKRAIYSISIRDTDWDFIKLIFLEKTS